MVIRLVHPDDERPLKRLVFKYLQETYAQGGDYPATLENAAVFTKLGIDGAAAGDPCLVAEDDGTIVAFCMARGTDIPGTTARYVTIRSWGTYVIPEYRNTKTSIKLFMVMGRLAKQAGYTRVIGFTHGTGYEKHALQVVNNLAGMKEIGKILMWHLGVPKEEVATPEATVDA
jgi:hypothetical protein